MKIRVRYTCEGRDRDYIVSPIGGGIYSTLEEYQAEMLRWFPNAIVEEFVEIVEFEL
jgi:hypothetical protein